MAKHFFTKEQKEYIKNKIKGRYVNDLLKDFNQQFNLEIEYSQLRTFIKNNKFTSGVNSRFKKGQESWNSGKKGYTGPNSTSFVKGMIPHNYKELGTERINGDGYIDVKIADPDKWKAKHRIIWEEHNEDIPKNHVILFGDGNRLNVDIDNLICVSRAQLARLNKQGLIQNDVELTRTAINIVDLQMKINDLSKSHSINRKI